MTIAGIALTAGSTVMNTMAQGKVDKARDDALAAERIRQNGLDQEAKALNVQSQDRYENIDDKREGKAQELGDYFAGQSIQANAAAEGVNAPPSTNNIVVQEQAKQQGKAKDFTNKQGAALGELRSFGDLLGGISREQARDATQVGVLGGFKRGSSNVVPYELEEANSAGDGLKMFGDLLNLGGGMAMNSGLSGGSMFGAKPATMAGLPASAPIPAARPVFGDPWKGMRSVGSLASIYGR